MAAMYSVLVLCVLLSGTSAEVMNRTTWTDCCVRDDRSECEKTATGVLGNFNEQRYKRICQKYRNEYHFATLYDTQNKIPVFSMATYNGRSRIRRPYIPRFYVEPQLENINEPEMQQETRGHTYGHQAVNGDYNRILRYSCNRGHLYPQASFQTYESKAATFTLTNVIPQRISLNSGCWNRVEWETRQFISGSGSNGWNTIAVGAVPGPSNVSGVNIPVYVWSYVRLWDTDSVLGFVVPNVENDDVQSNRWLTIYNFKQARHFLDLVRHLYSGNRNAFTNIRQQRHKPRIHNDWALVGRSPLAILQYNLQCDEPVRPQSSGRHPRYCQCPDLPTPPPRRHNRRG